MEKEIPIHTIIFNRIKQFVAESGNKYDTFPLLAFVEWDARKQQEDI